MAKKPVFEDLVDMTAMVDIVFFVLIFFMVSSMQGVFASLKVPMPDKTAEKGTRTRLQITSDKDSAIVRIDRDSSIFVNDSEIPGGSDIELRNRVREAKQTCKRMVVMAASEAKHGVVVQALDAGNDAGFEELQLTIDDDT